MAVALARRRRSSERGQTTLEYLMLLGMSAITAYILVQGPISIFTDQMLGRIRGALGNVVQNADLKSGPVVGPGQSGHPGDQARLKPLHL